MYTMFVFTLRRILFYDAFFLVKHISFRRNHKQIIDTSLKEQSDLLNGMMVLILERMFRYLKITKFIL